MTLNYFITFVMKNQYFNKQKCHLKQVISCCTGPLLCAPFIVSIYCVVVIFCAASVVIAAF